MLYYLVLQYDDMYFESLDLCCNGAVRTCWLDAHRSKLCWALSRPQPATLTTPTHDDQQLHGLHFVTIVGSLSSRSIERINSLLGTARDKGPCHCIALLPRRTVWRGWLQIKAIVPQRQPPPCSPPHRTLLNCRQWEVIGNTHEGLAANSTVNVVSSVPTAKGCAHSCRGLQGTPKRRQNCPSNEQKRVLPDPSPKHDHQATTCTD